MEHSGDSTSRDGTTLFTEEKKQFCGLKRVGWKAGNVGQRSTWQYCSEKGPVRKGFSILSSHTSKHVWNQLLPEYKPLGLRCLHLGIVSIVKIPLPSQTTGLPYSHVMLCPDTKCNMNIKVWLAGLKDWTEFGIHGLCTIVRRLSTHWMERVNNYCQVQTNRACSRVHRCTQAQINMWTKLVCSLQRVTSLLINCHWEFVHVPFELPFNSGVYFYISVYRTGAGVD